VSAWLAYAFGAVGDAEALAAEREDLAALSLRGQVTAFDQALVALGRGENAQALSFLEQAHATDSQWLGWLKSDRVFAPVRSDARFEALLAKVNLAD